MTRKLRALMVTVSVGILVYLVSLASVSVAEVGSAAGEERLADVTVSLEACVVRVEIEAVGDSADNADYRALSLAKAERLLSRVGDEGTEVVSGVKLLVGNGSEAEISTEDKASEKEKDQESGTGEHADRETSVSLQAEAIVSTAGEITVEFDFRQVFSENGLSGSGEGEREEEFVQIFEVSSRVGLQVRRPRIVGAKRNEDEAMFLILYADI